MMVGVLESLILSPYLRINLGTPHDKGDLEQDFKGFFSPNLYLGRNLRKDWSWSSYIFICVIVYVIGLILSSVFVDQDFRFQFMNTVRVSDKPLNLTYIHSKGDNRTILDGNLVFDSANKVSANHVLGSGNCKLKYSYVHGGVTTFEPSYDLAKDSWDFAVSQKVYGDDVFRASYQTSSKALGLDWSRNSKLNGSFKV